MSEQSREAKLSKAFVALADTLVADFDLVDLLRTLVDTSADVLDVTAAGLMLKGDGEDLHLVASTTEDANFVEVVQLAAAEGPCLDCVRSGRAVSVPDIDATADRWPAFREAALGRGFQSLHATPLRLRDDVIGTMNLFDTSVGALKPEDVAAAQALSDVATIGILSDRATRERDLLTSQLEYALDSRIVIEQAKGVIAQSAGVSMDDAFSLLRNYARNTNQRLRALATDLVERRIDVSLIARATRGGGRPAGRQGRREARPED